MLKSRPSPPAVSIRANQINQETKVETADGRQRRRPKLRAFGRLPAHKLHSSAQLADYCATDEWAFIEPSITSPQRWPSSPLASRHLALHQKNPLRLMVYSRQHLADTRRIQRTSPIENENQKEDKELRKYQRPDAAVIRFRFDITPRSTLI